MAEGDVVLPLCCTRLRVIPSLTGYLDSRSGSGMIIVMGLGVTVVMCNVLLAVATREWLLGFVP